MKIYYFLNNAGKNSFDNILSKIELLKSGYTTFELINNYYNKVGVYNKDGISDANFIETLSFIEFCKNKYDLTYIEILNQIKWVFDDNFFIHNEDIYIQESNEFKKIETDDKVYFITSRDSFSSPFFLILKSISEKNKNIKIVKYNNRLNHWSYNDKSFYLSKMYEYRKKYIGDIIIPLFQNKNIKNIKLFFDKSKELIGNKIVIKKNFGDMGLGIKAVKIDELFDDRLEYLKDKFIPDGHGNFQGIYLIPYIKIQKEFRVYYRYKNKNEIEIYSIKNRINKIGDEIFYKSSFKIYENIDVEWKYMNINDFKENKKYLAFIKKICIKIDDNCGVLEFFQDNKGKIYFCEINSLGGSIMFPGIDQENMINYYIDTLKMIF